MIFKIGHGKNDLRKQIEFQKLIVFTNIKREWIEFELIVSWWYNDLSEIRFQKLTMQRYFFTKLNISSSKLNSWIIIKKIWDTGKWSNRWGGERGLCYWFKLWYLAKNIQYMPYLAGHTPFLSPSRGHLIPIINFSSNK